MLTKGAIRQIANNVTDIRPILQILDIKCVTGQHGERFRVVLSDGDHYIQGMLTTGMAAEMSSKLEKHDIIQLHEFMCPDVSGKKLCVVVNCTIVQKTACIGKPKNVLAILGDNYNVCPLSGTFSDRELISVFFLNLSDCNEQKRVNSHCTITNEVSIPFKLPSNVRSFEDQLKATYNLCIENGDIQLRVKCASENEEVVPPPRKKRKVDGENQEQRKSATALDDDEKQNVVRVSSCILCAASPVFKQMMTANMMESQSKEIEIHAKSPDTVKHMVYFMCTGQLPEEVNPLDLIELSHLYQLDRLFYKSAERLCETVTVDNYVKTVQILNKYDIEQGFDMVVPFGKEHIEELKKRDDFSSLSCAFKRVILGVSKNDC